MVSICNVVSKIIHGNETFCTLCFRDVGANPVQLEDVVLKDIRAVTMCIVLEYVLGTEITNNIFLKGAVCKDCKTSAVESYNFIKQCEQNTTKVYHAIDSILEVCDNTIPNISDYSTLFVSLNTDDFSSQQYYDNEYVKEPSVVFERFAVISKAEKKCVLMTNRKSHVVEEQKTRVNGTRRRIKKRAYLEYNIPEINTADILYDVNNLTHLKCKVCLKIFKEEIKLRGHYFKKHYPRNVKCNKCPRSFISIEMLKLHYRDNHKDLICSQCGKKFTNKYILHKHEVNHNVQIVCQHCGRVYRSKEAFQKHITDNVCPQKTRKTSKQAIYTCDYCTKKFNYKPYLAKHIKHEHEHAEGFKCDFCGKTCYTLSGLKSHIVKHTLEKSFVCSLCDRRFVSKTSLLYHTRLHTGEQPYQCDYCEKAFLSASRRLDHVRRHHLVPGLECDLCHKKFKATNSLLKHKKKHFDSKCKLSQVNIGP